MADETELESGSARSQNEIAREGIRVAIVEDNNLFREMLVATINATPGMTLVASCATAQAARTQILPGSAHIVLMDISLPDGNGIALGLSLQRRDSKLRVLLLSAHNAMELLLDLPQGMQGKWSYLSKNSCVSVTMLLAAIRRTTAGRQVLDPGLVDKARPRVGTSVAALSARRYEVLRLLAQGLSNAGIAERLGIADKSVQNHVNSIYTELGIDPDPNENPRVIATLRMLEETGTIAGE
ncbi:response regulator [Rarobacter incanus]|uniref:LuxR family two component transcriptional regulator n=1 Tax=Rarobacter incanus TaxID=153494 RepID=A0A542SQC9_9MICO|nr:response regulator transcription factor [Rarobacter incanus]TQK76467.1 LuxR family two component transcriptional regulator [Rarobacter incanus]